MIKCYQPIEYDASYIVNAVQEYLPKAIWRWKTYMTVAVGFHLLSEPIVQSDRLLKQLHDKFQPQLRLYQIPSKSFYRFHKDALFDVSMNMILEQYNCHTVFINEVLNEHVYKLDELVYTPQKFYLFNTQIPHAVMNLDDRERVLVSFNFPKGISFETVDDWYQNEFLPQQ